LSCLFLLSFFPLADYTIPHVVAFVKGFWEKIHWQFAQTFAGIFVQLAQDIKIRLAMTVREPRKLIQIQSSKRKKKESRNKK